MKFDYSVTQHSPLCTNCVFLYLLCRSCEEKRHEIQEFNYFFSSLMRGLGRHWGEISSSSWGKETHSLTHSLIYSFIQSSRINCDLTTECDDRAQHSSFLRCFISSEGALKLLTTYDNHPSNQSHPIPQSLFKHRNSPWSIIKIF